MTYTDGGFYTGFYRENKRYAFGVEKDAQGQIKCYWYGDDGKSCEITMREKELAALVAEQKRPGNQTRPGLAKEIAETESEIQRLKITMRKEELAALLAKVAEKKRLV